MITNAKIGGAALILSSAGIVAGMAHHPAGPHSALAGPVHALLILLLGLAAFGFAAFVAARGPGRPLLLAGAVAYGFGLFGHLGAAMVSGFIAPALAARGDAVGADLFLLAWESNQALASLGVVAAGAAILLWSLDLLARPGAGARIVGGAGIVAGILPSALLAAGLMEMSLAGAFIAYALHAGWAAALGIHMLRRPVAAPRGHGSTPA
jgi:hypothetical protein